MRTEAQVRSQISLIAGRLAEQLAPERIILFGSHARGDSKTDSDLDLLLLFAEVEDPRERAAQAYSALAGFADIPVDIVVSTTARFERYRNVVNTVYWPASREGKILYERAA